MHALILAAAGVGVWWHWMGYEITRAGITRDLEAMRASYVADATIFNVTSHSGDWCGKPIENVPDPAVSYWNHAWWALVRHAAAEAKRCGISLGMEVAPGYTHTGGPWVRPEGAMKKLVWSVSYKANPPIPPHDSRFYQDITFLTVGKKFYRFGYTLTGATSGPAPDDIDKQCLEADKMSRKAMLAHADAFLAGLRSELGEYLGKGFDFVAVDSYEVGGADWTDDFPERFKTLAGYDPLPFLPVFAGEKMKDGEKFLDDFARVKAQLYLDGFRALAERFREAGLKVRIEPYDCPFTPADGAVIADLPMDEFWAAGDWQPRFLKPGERVPFRIVGAEAFTSDAGTADWTLSPRDFKFSADRAFAYGINHLCLHDWVHQPFSEKWKPGMSMGFFGSHFGENQTWYEPGKAFFKYLADSQGELRRGVSVRAGVRYENGVLSCERREGVTNIWFFANLGGAKAALVAERTEVVLESGESRFVESEKELAFAVGEVPPPKPARILPLEGPWEVSFEAGRGAPEKPIVLTDLKSLTEIAIPGVRYFSGTASYSKEFWFYPPQAGERVLLDLGGVREMAELILDGKSFGVKWCPPYVFDITDYVKGVPLAWGKKRIDPVIRVTNTWHNRLVGDNLEPDDCDWYPPNPRRATATKLCGRGIRRIPDFVMKDGERPSRGRIGWSDWDYFAVDTPLIPAGLLGPVTLRFEN